jgi:DNA-binding transcriptional MerR regulator
MTTGRGGRLTIGALARQAGVSPQTLRHYHRLGLLRPAATSTGGYRLYTDQDRARLELIRALRALDLDLDTIAKLLRGAVGLRRVAELHLRTLDLQVRTLERRRAVLRVLLRSEQAPTAERLAQLQALAGFEQMERERFLQEQLGARLRGTSNAALARWIQTAAIVDLPEHATEAQVEAWLELADMVSDPAFLERHRRAVRSPAVHGAPSSGDPAQWLAAMNALYGPAAKAAAARVDPRSEKARRLVRRWVRSLADESGRRDVRPFAERLLRAIDQGRDAREERFWHLVGVLKPQVARSPVSVAWPWLMSALRAWIDDGEVVKPVVVSR